MKEEEDAFDKVATERENAGDRLYMSDVSDGFDSHFVTEDCLPGAVGSGGRDRRANGQVAVQIERDKTGQSPSTSEKYLKPILKRKELETASKPSKRVRFGPAFVGNVDGAREVSSMNTSTETIHQDSVPALNEKVLRIPDYVQNPSDYTRYGLDSTDEMRDQSNTNAVIPAKPLLTYRRRRNEKGICGDGEKGQE